MTQRLKVVPSSVAYDMAGDYFQVLRGVFLFPKKVECSFNMQLSAWIHYIQLALKCIILEVLFLKVCYSVLLFSQGYS